MNRGLVPHGPAEQGFSLIEVIFTLVVFAILASILVTAMGSSLTASSTPIARLQQTMALHQAMENIRAKFEKDMEDIWDDPDLTTEAERETARADALDNLKTAIGAVGTSPSNEFGSYEVVENKYITFASHNEVAATDGILKVSIRDASGLVLTELLVAR